MDDINCSLVKRELAKINHVLTTTTSITEGSENITKKSITFKMEQYEYTSEENDNKYIGFVAKDITIEELADFTKKALSSGAIFAQGKYIYDLEVGQTIGNFYYKVNDIYSTQTYYKTEDQEVTADNYNFDISFPDRTENNKLEFAISIINGVYAMYGNLLFVPKEGWVKKEDEPPYIMTLSYI